MVKCPYRPYYLKPQIQTPADHEGYYDVTFEYKGIEKLAGNHTCYKIKASCKHGNVADLPWEMDIFYGVEDSVLWSVKMSLWKTIDVAPNGYNYCLSSPINPLTYGVLPCYFFPFELPPLPVRSDEHIVRMKREGRVMKEGKEERVTFKSYSIDTSLIDKGTHKEIKAEFHRYTWTPQSGENEIVYQEEIWKSGKPWWSRATDQDGYTFILADEFDSCMREKKSNNQ